MKTNTVSNTAFRGFGGPQGMMVAERVIDEIAWSLGLDPLDVRKRNLYREGRDVTPYGMEVEDNILPGADRPLRRRERLSAPAARWCARSTPRAPILKRGIALTPVKFGISFTTTHLNQAGALVHVYQDGSVHLNHGGTEMGQGLYIKVAQVVAEEFGVDVEQVKITATTTAKVPNTSRDRGLLRLRHQRHGGEERRRRDQGAAHRVCGGELTTSRSDQIAFRDNRVFVGNRSMPFAGPDQAGLLRARLALLDRLLSHAEDPLGCQDRAGPAVLLLRLWRGLLAKSLVDVTTGEMKLTRVDILHDVGRSLNPAVDIGQIEGGFVQGMGWLTTEELVFAPGRAPAHPRAVDLQDPVRVRRARRISGDAVGRREPRGHDLSLQGGRRAAVDAGDLGVRGDCGCDP